jgi:hypothetical protein
VNQSSTGRRIVVASWLDQNSIAARSRGVPDRQDHVRYH